MSRISWVAVNDTAFGNFFDVCVAAPGDKSQSKIISAASCAMVFRPANFIEFFPASNQGGGIGSIGVSEKSWRRFPRASASLSKLHQLFKRFAPLFAERKPRQTAKCASKPKPNQNGAPLRGRNFVRFSSRH